MSLKEGQLISIVEDLINLPVEGYRHPGFYLENFVWEGSFEHLSMDHMAFQGEDAEGINLPPLLWSTKILQETCKSPLSFFME